MRLVGIDIGGTFTDLALYDSDDGRTQVHKVHSTPDDPAARSSPASSSSASAPGSSRRASTACCTGRPSRRTRCSSTDGARTGMVTTEGVRDVLHIGRHQRPEPYSVMQDIPWQAGPFVERQGA